MSPSWALWCRHTMTSSRNWLMPQSVASQHEPPQSTKKSLKLKPRISTVDKNSQVCILTSWIQASSCQYRVQKHWYYCTVLNVSKNVVPIYNIHNYLTLFIIRFFSVHNHKFCYKCKSHTNSSQSQTYINVNRIYSWFQRGKIMLSKPYPAKFAIKML